MKPKQETVDYIINTVANKQWGCLDDDIIEDIYRIGAYHGAFDEQNFGKDCRRNSVYGFLETLQALVKYK